MKKPANVYLVLEEFFSEQRDESFEAILLNRPLFTKAKTIIDQGLVEDSNV